MDLQKTALATVDGLLSRSRSEPLSSANCLQMVELAPLVPGRVREMARALGEQGDSASMEGLLLLSPTVPGVVEAVFRNLGAGVSRRRLDGSFAPRMLALDFRHSRAHDFGDALGRAHVVFGEDLERLLVKGRHHYRVSVREGRGTLAGRSAAASQDIQWLHRRLGRLKGTRLWLNGWCLPLSGRFGAGVQSHLVRSWLAWAARQTGTRPSEEPGGDR